MPSPPVPKRRADFTRYAVFRSARARRSRAATHFGSMTPTARSVARYSLMRPSIEVNAARMSALGTLCRMRSANSATAEGLKFPQMRSISSRMRAR